MTQRRSAFIATLLLTLLCSASSALAQAVTGAIPRAESPQTWQRPDGGCSGVTSINPTTRRFNIAHFSLTGPGSYTMTATRADGGFIAIDDYGSFAGTSAGFECSNRNHLNAISGMGSVSRTFSCVGTICSSGTFTSEVVISVGPTDTVPITFSVTGGPAVTYACALAGSTSSFSPSSQAIPAGGGSFSSAFTFGSSSAVPPPRRGRARACRRGSPACRPAATATRRSTTRLPRTARPRPAPRRSRLAARHCR